MMRLLTKLHIARRRVDRSPTPEQIEAGNYRKGHVTVQGLDITIENPKGSVRRSPPGAATPWARRMVHDYGYVKRTDGADGDQVDVFLGPDLTSDLCFVMNQIDQRTHVFDEHKLLLGFHRPEEAVAAYLAHYPKGWLLGPITTLTIPELRNWLQWGDQNEPLPEWHRPCLWARLDEGPEVIAKAVEFAVLPDGTVRAMEVLAKAAGDIKYGDNYLGVDKAGRPHWRAMEQLDLELKAKGGNPLAGKSGVTRESTTTILPLDEYDKIIVSFSGGKDSIAMALHLLEMGVPRERIELWHQLVDGAPGSPMFMDWRVTESYVTKVADALGLALRLQWREGGFQGELYREGRAKSPVAWQTATGEVEHNEPTGPRTDKGWTRRRWPLAAKDMKRRWCSGHLKIEVAISALTHDPRFQHDGAKVLFLTGERRQESDVRATYAPAVRHPATTLKRRVDKWRPILEWDEKEVWAILKRWKINPHPCYQLGYGRLSCMPCVYGDPAHWATLRVIDPERFDLLARAERELHHNIDIEGRSVEEKANAIDPKTGQPAQSFVKRTPETERLMALALSAEYTDPVIVPDQWQLPKGAFKGSAGGPT